MKCGAARVGRAVGDVPPERGGADQADAVRVGRTPVNVSLKLRLVAPLTPLTVSVARSVSPDKS